MTEPPGRAPHRRCSAARHRPVSPAPAPAPRVVVVHPAAPGPRPHVDRRPRRAVPRASAPCTSTSSPTGPAGTSDPGDGSRPTGRATATTSRPTPTRPRRRPPPTTTTAPTSGSRTTATPSGDHLDRDARRPLDARRRRRRRPPPAPPTVARPPRATSAAPPILIQSTLRHGALTRPCRRARSSSWRRIEGEPSCLNVP